MYSSKNVSKKSFLPVCIMANYLLGAAITYLICLTGGTPSIYANLIVIPIVLVALFTPIWHSVFFATLCGLCMGPLQCWILGGNWSDLTWLIRLSVYVVLASVISYISTKTRKRENFYEQLATHDPLTGLENIQSLTRKEYTDCTMSILMLSFPDSSDMQGLFGNEFYQNIMSRISKDLLDLLKPYPNAKLYKGSDLNFAVTVQHHNSEESLENILASLDNLNDVTIHIDQVPIYVSYRIGFTVLSAGDKISDGVRNANIALRYSFLKDQQISRYTEAMRDYYKGVMSIASEFPASMAKGMVQASYQTIHDAKTREPVSVEILAKWVREDGSKMTAEEFVPILKKTSCLHDLTMFMTKEALRYAKLPLNLNNSFSINFSSSELNEKSIQEFVRTIEDSGIEPGRVMVEITGRFSDDAYLIRENLQFLHKHGIRIAIDLFSSGFSSCVVFTDMPIDVIKLSRSITSHAGNERGYSLIKSISAFAKEMGIKTVAEGIENEEQARLCSQAGIDYLQGYHFSVPRLLKNVENDLDLMKAPSASEAKDPESAVNPGISMIRKNDRSEGNSEG